MDEKEELRVSYITAINSSNIELYGIIKDNYERMHNILPIVDFINDRVGVILDLIEEYKVWDAEIIHRCVLETFMKLFYICTSPDEEKKSREKEFWYDLEEINKIKQSEQAKKNLKQKNLGEVMRLSYSPIVLSEEEEKMLKLKWNKTRRKKLEQRWSFSEIVNSLIKNYKGKYSPYFILLSHSYRMSSHVSHGDETGIGIIYERNHRTEAEKSIADYSHYLGLLSNCCYYCIGLGISVTDYLSVDNKFFLSLIDSMKATGEKVEKLQLKLYDDPLYDKYKS